MSLVTLLRPQSVAIVGASKTPGKIGYALLRNVIESGYKGRIYPVNPSEKEIEGLPCYPEIKAVGAPVDLAVIAVPAP
ncbi:MAG: CoA-binding protein, partial [Desulfotomaculales bacterium]